jgi:hypothetical protein
MIHFRRRVLKLYQNRLSNVITDIPVNKKQQQITNSNQLGIVIKIPENKLLNWVKK